MSTSPTIAMPDHVVFDDVLSPVDFEAIQRHLARERFSDVHEGAGGHGRVWTQADGRPLRGPAFASGSILPASDIDTDAFHVACVPLLRAIAGCMPHIGTVAGVEGKDWQGIAARAWLHPPGTGLGWHDDSRSYAGAFVFFAHPVWRLDWAGELMLLEGRPEPAADTSTESIPSALLAPLGLPAGAGGRFIVARPNRLVILASGVLHRVAPVSVLAGHHVRATISGFFLRAQSSEAA